MLYENIKDTEKINLKIWKEHMEKIMNEENKSDHMMETDVVEEPI